MLTHKVQIETASLELFGRPLTGNVVDKVLNS